MKIRQAAACGLATATVLATLVAAPAAHASIGTAGNRIAFQQRLEPIDGLGFASPFQRSTLIRGDRGLSPESTRAVLDLLFDREKGAGSSIVRIGIGSSTDSVYDHMKTIEPNDPGSPDSTPQYVWDGDDGGQLWLLKEAQKYGVRRILADAWSAPGFMKTTGTDIRGGELCGVPGTACASGDWRQAYANYLVQYLRFYRQEGIRITDLGFTNEPDFTSSYASMRFTPEQAVDFIKVVGPTLRGSRLGTELVCCDSFGWQQQAPYSAAIEADPVADRYVKTHTAHFYASRADGPLPTDDRVWMSEWTPNGSVWDEAWDDGTPASGFTMAESIHEAFAVGAATGYVSWVGASLGATRAFIQIAGEGDGYRVSKRLWGFAAYSRFIRPHSYRVPVRMAEPGVEATAFRNADGSLVVELLNTNTTAVTTSFTSDTRIRQQKVYQTDETHSVDLVADANLHGGCTVGVQLAPRALTTLVLR